MLSFPLACSLPWADSYPPGIDPAYAFPANPIVLTSRGQQVRQAGFCPPAGRPPPLPAWPPFSVDGAQARARALHCQPGCPAAKPAAGPSPPPPNSLHRLWAGGRDLRAPVSVRKPAPGCGAAPQAPQLLAPCHTGRPRLRSLPPPARLQVDAASYPALNPGDVGAAPIVTVIGNLAPLPPSYTAGVRAVRGRLPAGLQCECLPGGRVFWFEESGPPNLPGKAG